MTVDPTGLGPGPGSPAETGIGIETGSAAGSETGITADRAAGRGGRERGGER
ncbi:MULTISPECIES: hypothetical protein [Streptomyces]|uniref:hypothetical protein n=1 Tax=Streptomyces TaxID=1883 RepID=UPI00163C5395|nr:MULTISPECIES: hypothetical protein [Streptomyces]MBC2875102.1 hypothetical protein [Streptomyces sp. TYQ1024]UBI36939.1 hypothetical protein K7I03_11035 [Streptomyces mobaraensis]UKW29532.1 hypothetical protein MCU78_11015 [Streptomyces sp. TYQ1024]